MIIKDVLFWIKNNSVTEFLKYVVKIVIESQKSQSHLYFIVIESDDKIHSQNVFLNFESLNYLKI